MAVFSVNILENNFSKTKKFSEKSSIVLNSKNIFNA